MPFGFGQDPNLMGPQIPDEELLRQMRMESSYASPSRINAPQQPGQQRVNAPQEWMNRPKDFMDILGVDQSQRAPFLQGITTMSEGFGSFQPIAAADVARGRKARPGFIAEDARRELATEEDRLTPEEANWLNQQLGSEFVQPGASKKTISEYLPGILDSQQMKGTQDYRTASLGLAREGLDIDRQALGQKQADSILNPEEAQRMNETSGTTYFTPGMTWKEADNIQQNIGISRSTETAEETRIRNKARAKGNVADMADKSVGTLRDDLRQAEIAKRMLSDPQQSARGAENAGRFLARMLESRPTDRDVSAWDSMPGLVGMIDKAEGWIGSTPTPRNRADLAHLIDIIMTTKQEQLQEGTQRVRGRAYEENVGILGRDEVDRMIGGDSGAPQQAMGQDSPDFTFSRSEIEADGYTIEDAIQQVPPGKTYEVVE